jgi:ribonucleoside-diphosphate reductase alpha chain
MEHYAWTVGLTRMISAVFRRGGDVSFVVEELKAVFDPRGGCWMEGRYVPSLLAAIGEVIERHMIDVGFMPDPKRALEELPVEARLKVAQLAPPASASSKPSDQRLRQCPKCGSAGLIRQEGCDLCTSCGYSRCG